MIRFLSATLLFTFSFLSAKAYDIIPKPAFQTSTKEKCLLAPGWQWDISGDSSDKVRQVYLQFHQWADTMVHGYFPDLGPLEPHKGKVVLRITANKKANAFSYSIDVKANQITVSSPTTVGLFYGLQSLKQLVFQKFRSDKPIFCGVIKDEPAFGWRGMHLDVSRHFFTIKEVETYIEMMAMHKMNVFHWHLTDDQGWRLEIKAFPKLTEVAAWRTETMVGKYTKINRKFDGIRHGGFYTQEEVKHIVQFAASRMITVVPEIEMPGHSQELIAAYPYLGSSDTVPGVMTVWGGTDHILNPYPPTFQFLFTVLDEVMALFPGKYIHIGGDEALKMHWKRNPKIQKFKDSLKLKNEDELQSWFIRQVDNYLVSKGRSLIGWDEILEGGLAQNAAVMSWRGEKGGIAAAKMKHHVVMTPGTHCYFDHYQHQPREQEPLAIGGFTNLEKVYSYNPLPAELTKEEQGYILGAQANVWTEYIADFRQVQYMTLPRMAALAEVVWTKNQVKDWPAFQLRAKELAQIYGAMSWKYCRWEL